MKPSEFAAVTALTLAVATGPIVYFGAQYGMSVGYESRDGEVLGMYHLLIETTRQRDCYRAVAYDYAEDFYEGALVERRVDC